MPAASDESERDERFMRLALGEASRGVGRTSPNPAVGAVIVRGGRIVARGFHRAAGEPHAEIEALCALKRAELAVGATMYVTLEPCSTHGRTPPCTRAILAAGISRVVIGATDPNPSHAGRAEGILAAAGCLVKTGVLGAECSRLNRAFNRWIVSGKPWVIAKAAITLDGRLTRPPGESRWLSGKSSRTHAHRLRAQVDAILVGAGTVRADNPRLTVRGVAGVGPGRQPWRVVLTRSGDLPADAHVLTDEWRERTLVFQGKALSDVLADLGKEQVTSVLIEGGGQVLGEAFREDLVDEVCFYMTPRISGGETVAVAGFEASLHAPTLSECRYERIGSDVLIRGEIFRDLP